MGFNSLISAWTAVAQEPQASTRVFCWFGCSYFLFIRVRELDYLHQDHSGYKRVYCYSRESRSPSYLLTRYSDCS